MVELKSNKGHVTVKIAGKNSTVLVEMLMAIRAFFVSMAENLDEDDAFEIYKTFVEALNDGAPLDWKTILEEAREGREDGDI